MKSCIISGKLLSAHVNEREKVDTYEMLNDFLVNLFRDIMGLEERAIITGFRAAHHDGTGHSQKGIRAVFSEQVQQ